MSPIVINILVLIHHISTLYQLLEWSVRALSDGKEGDQPPSLLSTGLHHMTLARLPQAQNVKPPFFPLPPVTESCWHHKISRIILSSNIDGKALMDLVRIRMRNVYMLDGDSGLKMNDQLLSDYLLFKKEKQKKGAEIRDEKNLQ